MFSIPYTEFTEWLISESDGCICGVVKKTLPEHFSILHYKQPKKSFSFKLKPINHPILLDDINQEILIQQQSS